LFDPVLDLLLDRLLLLHPRLFTASLRRRIFLRPRPLPVLTAPLHRHAHQLASLLSRSSSDSGSLSRVALLRRRHRRCVDLVMEGVAPHLLHPLEDAMHLDSLTILDGGRAEREHLHRVALVGEPECLVRVAATRRSTVSLASRAAHRHGLVF